MFGRRKRPAVYFWIGETHFIQEVIRKLQVVVDRSEYDIRLVYRQAFSFPDKYWKIALELHDGEIPTSISDIDQVENVLLETLETSQAFEKAKKALFWLTPGNRNSCTVVEISYVVSSYCVELGKPGIIIYWKRGSGYWDY